MKKKKILKTISRSKTDFLNIFTFNNSQVSFFRNINTKETLPYTIVDIYVYILNILLYEIKIIL